ncbi:outer membrane protein assembly factor BamC [Candidatus Thioglobus sp.]|nr:outer membrane protein assembly factor BamC [Candidatus Thioglobus sp.]
MKNFNYLTMILLSLLAISCSKVTDPVKKIGLGSRVVNYQADEKVDSLVIPPDLTKPSSQGEFTKVNDSIDQKNVIKTTRNVEVKRDKYRRWLLVDITPNEVWTLSKEFFRSYNFKIEKENQKIGIFETEFLEIETKVPDKSLGAIRAALSKALQTQYGLPIADKYRIRIEPTIDPSKTEIYLTLSSIGEVVIGEKKLWQPREKDVELETEMLLQLMVFLGEDRIASIAKIQSNLVSIDSVASVINSDTGYATLVLPYDKKQSWKLLGWALDELSIHVDDKDSIEASYLIKVTPKNGFLSSLLSSVSDQTYQLVLKELGNNQTHVIFVDLSEENDQDIINFSSELFNNIAKKF